MVMARNPIFDGIRDRRRPWMCVGVYRSFVVHGPAHPALSSAPTIWRRRSESILDGDDKMLERYTGGQGRERESRGDQKVQY
jgi:hypothetical protein